MTHLKFIIFSEMFTHYSGQCSDAECEYSSSKFTIKIPIPEQYKDLPVNTIITDFSDELWNNHYKVRSLKYDIECKGSGYCDGCHIDLDKHEGRFKVLECKVVEISKKN